MLRESQQQESAELLKTSFKLDPEGLSARGRSLQLLLLHRRCASCWGGLIQEQGQGLEVEVAEHLERIANHCSISPEFIHPQLTIMEAAFRVLLSNGGQPMTLQSMYEALQERWSNPRNPRTPSAARLHRMLLADTFYGISQVSEAGEQ